MSMNACPACGRDCDCNEPIPPPVPRTPEQTRNDELEMRRLHQCEHRSQMDWLRPCCGYKWIDCVKSGGHVVRIECFQCGTRLVLAKDPQRDLPLEFAAERATPDAR